MTKILNLYRISVPYVTVTTMYPRVISMHTWLSLLHTHVFIEKPHIPPKGINIRLVKGKARPVWDSSIELKL